MTANTAIRAFDPIGAEFYRTMNATTIPAGAVVPLFELGTVARGENDSWWVYVYAAAAIKAYRAVTIDSLFNAVVGTAANATKQLQVGFAQTAFAAGDYGWVCQSANGGILCGATNVQPNANVTVGRSTMSAGVLGVSGASGSSTITGVVTVTTALSTSVHNVELIAVYPRHVR